MLAAIREAELPPGSRLPTEHELCEQFGVSRTVIREALRHLAAKRVLDATGSGGVRVAAPGHAGVSESLSLYLTSKGALDPQKINEVRQTLELATAAMAAERASDEQLTQITAECERMAGLGDDSEQASLVDVAFHRAIAEATNNELYLVLVDSLADVLLHIRRETLGIPGRVATTMDQHRAIVGALERRDADAAVRSMREHLDDSFTTYRSTGS